ncbi:TetR family transcriptional regulator, partial [Pseudomonas gessardii]|uniref:TetR/AcrR family transcriptional regulator n=1 Tax=Pseudomonas gessardii TaxID=78544 RepID=UPI001F96BEB2
MPKAASLKTEAPTPASRTKKKALPDTGASQVKPGERRIAANGGAGIKVKPNRRSEETIANILKATEEVVLLSGADRISILDVCQVAGVSRGTFYLYFASQEDL